MAGPDAPGAGRGGAAGAAWKRAEDLGDQALAAWAARGEVRSALEIFRPRGRLSTRSQAEAAIVRAPGRRETLTFLDRVEERLAGLSLPYARKIKRRRETLQSC